MRQLHHEDDAERHGGMNEAGEKIAHGDRIAPRRYQKVKPGKGGNRSALRLDARRRPRAPGAVRWR